MSKKLLIGGGIAGVLAGAWALILSRKTTKAVEDAVKGVAPPVAPGGTNTIKLRLTHYYPFDAKTDAERKIEGGVKGAHWKDHKPGGGSALPLNTLQDYLAGKSDYVSLAGDYEIWPYGQKLLIPWGDKMLVGRVVDTGGHFHGINKMVRVLGAEPIDVCVLSRDDHPPKTQVDAQVVVGDHLDTSSAVAKLDKAGKPVVTGLIGLDVIVGFKTTLGVSRKEMPQIKSVDVQEFLDVLRKKGVSVEMKMQRVGDLKPSQNTLNLDKIKTLYDQGNNDPIIVSSDLYILDGHHRWGGLYAEDQNQQIQTYTVGLTIRPLLKAARAFPKAVRYGDEPVQSATQSMADWFASPRLTGLDVFTNRSAS